MEPKIYKTCSPKYTNQDIANMSGVQIFVSYARLCTTGIKQAIGLKENERMVGMCMDYDGINVYIETDYEK